MFILYYYIFYFVNLWYLNYAKKFNSLNTPKCLQLYDFAELESALIHTNRCLNVEFRVRMVQKEWGSKIGPLISFGKANNLGSLIISRGSLTQQVSFYFLKQIFNDEFLSGCIESCGCPMKDMRWVQESEDLQGTT